MSSYTCFLCRKDFGLEGDIVLELSEEEVLLCPDCADIVQRLTGSAGREVEIGD